MAEYGFDLAREWKTITYRRLWVLVQGLPADCSVWREETWTREEEFLAGLLEMTDVSSRRIVAALGGKLKGDPIHIERPFEEAERKAPKRVTTDSREIAAFFAAHN